MWPQDGLTYTCTLPVTRPPAAGPGANAAFPDLTTLLEGSRGNKFVDLLKKVVRCVWRGDRPPRQTAVSQFPALRATVVHAAPGHRTGAHACRLHR